MKRTVVFILSVLLCRLITAQTISFPTPELRTDTIKPLNSDEVTFMRPTTMINKLTIQGNRIPPTFYFQIVDSLGYNRFGVTKNGYLISGTHHTAQTSIDGLAMIGRGNTVLGADSYAIGKGIVNQADTAGAVGYYFTQSKDNSLAIGYEGNRIEFSADSGRFIGNWNLGSGSGSGGGITTESDPTVPAYVKSITTTNISNWNTAYGWGNHAASGYLTGYTESDPTVPAQVKAITSTNISNWNDLYDFYRLAKMYAVLSYKWKEQTLSSGSTNFVPINTIGPNTVDFIRIETEYVAQRLLDDGTKIIISGSLTVLKYAEDNSIVWKNKEEIGTNSDVGITITPTYVESSSYLRFDIQVSNSATEPVSFSYSRKIASTE